jgi:hypothetical protein
MGGGEPSAARSPDREESIAFFPPSDKNEIDTLKNNSK